MSLENYPLLNRFEALQGLLPAPLGLLRPTPLQPMGDEPRLWIKRDDLSASGYGGNKVRKLDFLLAEARARGARQVLSFGYAGSNFVAATAWHAHSLGIETLACLLPQADAPYVGPNLRASLAHGARLKCFRNEWSAVLGAIGWSLAERRRHGRSPVWIPPGGSNALGVCGFINAAFELDAQIAVGAMPEPERLYVAFSSMGTVAGLAIGLALCGRRTRIQAVRVVGSRHASRRGLRRLVARTSRHLARAEPAFEGIEAAAMSRVDLRHEGYGPGYARVTPAVEAARQRFGRVTGLCADSAYTAKALGVLYADREHDDGAVALYWHTYGGPPPLDGSGVPAGLPGALARHFPLRRHDGAADTHRS